MFTAAIRKEKDTYGSFKHDVNTRLCFLTLLLRRVLGTKDADTEDFIGFNFQHSSCSLSCDSHILHMSYLSGL